MAHQYLLIFERFYRVESSRNHASGRTGLGLAICYNVVEAHGGKINASASSLGGVKISIELPLNNHHKSQKV
ncbi:MAG TPA: ATP-binding protein [Arsenophonus sp.]